MTMSRICKQLCCLMALLTFVSFPPCAQSAPSALGQADESNKENRTLTTGDGWDIHITYYKGRGKESPVAILLPGVEGNDKSMNRNVWDGVATTLQKDGYAVITADLRKHGDSVPLDAEGKPDPRAVKLMPADYVLMAAQDLEAIKGFILAEHQKEQLNIRKLGIAAAGSSCLVASAFTVADWAKLPWPDAPTMALRTPKGQDVRALMMLSPQATVKGLNAATLMKNIADPLKGIAVHIYSNPSDRREKSSADKIFRFLELNEDPEGARMNIEGPSEEQFKAEGLLQGKAKPVMEGKIKEFFDKFVKGKTGTVEIKNKSTVGLPPDSGHIDSGRGHIAGQTTIART